MEVLSTNQKGNLTELQVMAAFVALGYTVNVPFGGNARYDFVAEKNNDFLRIQVKTGTVDNIQDPSVLEFSCNSSHYIRGKHVHTRYSKDEIDFFATYFNGQCYLVPVEECSDEKRLRFKSTKNNQKVGVNFTKDYILEEVLKR